jgi:hypothetical protein
MYFYMHLPKPRGIEDLINDFKESAGNFLSFYETMDSREKTLFKGWLHKLRIESHSPLLAATTEESSKLF